MPKASKLKLILWRPATRLPASAGAHSPRARIHPDRAGRENRPAPDPGLRLRARQNAPQRRHDSALRHVAGSIGRRPAGRRAGGIRGGFGNPAPDIAHAVGFCGR